MGHSSGATQLPFECRYVLLMHTHAVTASAVQIRNGLSNICLFLQVGIPQLDDKPCLSVSFGPLHSKANNDRKEIQSRFILELITYCSCNIGLLLLKIIKL